jgi:hypothetical protein
VSDLEEDATFESRRIRKLNISFLLFFMMNIRSFVTTDEIFLMIIILMHGSAILKKIYLNTILFIILPLLIYF